MNPLSQRSWRAIKHTYPEATGFFASLNLTPPTDDDTFDLWLASLEDAHLDELALEREQLRENFAQFMSGADQKNPCNPRSIETLLIQGGISKDGKDEQVRLEVSAGEIVCVVGPTGSGKSQLLCDIECLAQGDTPTRRTVFIDGRTPNGAERFSAAHKLVAQLSQSMNFVLDLSVVEFLDLHARGRRTVNTASLVTAVISEANTLCGEAFDGSTPLCALSGGQSRALMIADVALISHSPIVLIDELENAGVERSRALKLLVQEGKIVFIATHDPLLMLWGNASSGDEGRRDRAGD